MVVAEVWRLRNDTGESLRNVDFIQLIGTQDF